MDSTSNTSMAKRYNICEKYVIDSPGVKDPNYNGLSLKISQIIHSYIDVKFYKEEN